MHLYIMLSATNSLIGKSLRCFMKFQYNHVSVSFDNDFNNIYSFGRYFYNVPLVGGFVREKLNRLSINNSFLKVRIYKIPVTHEQIYAATKFIDGLENDNEKYLYNILSVVFSPVFGGFETYKSFTCSEFIAELLQYCEVLNLKDKPCKYTPKNLSLLLDDFPHYDDIILIKSEYTDDEFFSKNPGIVKSVHETVCFLADACGRKLFT